MAAAPRDARDTGPVRGALAEAKSLAAGLPDLLIEARRVAATVLAGWHGRRTSGRGETFWQFRPFVPGEPTAGIDWRRSARDDHLYVREKEWEAAHTIWLWVDLSAVDGLPLALGAGDQARPRARHHAGARRASGDGRRTGRPARRAAIRSLSRNAAERIAEILAHMTAPPGLPDPRPLRRFSDLVLIGDFLDPIAELEDDARRGRAHRRPRPSAAGRRPDRGDLPLYRPHRIRGSRDRHPPCRRPRRAVSRRLSGAPGGAARPAHEPLPPARLDVPDPPHRPAGDRAAARPPCPARRPRQPRHGAGFAGARAA